MQDYARFRPFLLSFLRNILFISNKSKNFWFPCMKSKNFLFPSGKLSYFLIFFLLRNEFLSRKWEKIDSVRKFPKLLWLQKSTNYVFRTCLSKIVIFRDFQLFFISRKDYICVRYCCACSEICNQENNNNNYDTEYWNTGRAETLEIAVKKIAEKGKKL